jgi:hypothetical protein
MSERAGVLGEDAGNEASRVLPQSRSPSLRSLGRKRRLWDNALDDEPDSSRLAAPDWRIWSQLQIQFQSGAGTTSL